MADEIKDVLDQQLKRSLEEHEPFPEFGGMNFQTVNLMPIPALNFSGMTGIGKTARVNQWAEANADKINFVSVNASDLVVTNVPIDGKNYPLIFTTEQAAELKKKGAVLFIDNYENIKPEVEKQIFNLIDNRVIYDISEKNPEVHLDDMYFIIVAVTT